MAPHVTDDDGVPATKHSSASLSIAKSAQFGQQNLLSTCLGMTNNLSQLLQTASTTTNGLTFYKPGNEGLEPTFVSYFDLLEEATHKARLLSTIEDLTPSTVLLLHFDSQHDTIEWFWAATLAGILPAISTPLVNDAVQRNKHLKHLQTLLQQPVILTAKHLIPEFDGIEGLRLHASELLECNHSTSPSVSITGIKEQKGDLAVLMLTSGSTGNAKAVALRHGQIIKAVQSKSSFHAIAPGDPFLNWVGMDHVASLTEIHLHAMSLGSDQVHVPAIELLRNPLRFIELLDMHKIVYTFAPNFFLAKILNSLKANQTMTADLSRLKAFIAGAEASVVTTCDALTREFRRFGVQAEVIRPGFGMTEMCGGTIYSLACPSYDLAAGLEFANLGTCIPGVEMRVVDLNNKTEKAPDGEVGEFQVSGPVVFNHYFNNAEATANSFSADGWFITGDLARIDEAGNLILAGRTKDIIVINGIKWSSTDIETAIEEEGIAGLIPTFTVAFSHRAADSPTEDLAIVYSPAYAPEDDQARFETAAIIAKIVALNTGWKPARLIPLPQQMLEKSSLGKISRSKVRAALENGEYHVFEKEDSEALRRYQDSKWRSPETKTAKLIQSILAELLKISSDDISLDSSIFDLGVNSFNLMLLKAKVQDALETKIDIPISVLLTEPTVGTIASSIETVVSEQPVYNPIVPLQPNGTKVPLFLVHPGSGDIIVFIALAAHFPTRPVYAIRTRGYNPNEGLFSSIRETAETYANYIRQTQPEGPYAIAGYSLGSTLAYEVGKELEAQGQEVRFLASIDYPPRVAHYVQDLDWVDVLLHISFYLELIDESTMLEITPHMRTLDREAAVKRIFNIGDVKRMQALALDAKRLVLITDITENLRLNLKSYEPVGTVDQMDVFVADPPKYAARDRQDWKENKLGQWAGFVRTSIEFHDCPGIHAKMLNREHTVDFARILKAAMRRRGV